MAHDHYKKWDKYDVESEEAEVEVNIIFKVGNARWRFGTFLLFERDV